MDQQVYFDDMIEFSSKLDSSALNIKQYNEFMKKRSKKKRKDKVEDNNFINIGGKSLDKAQFNLKKAISRRISVTAALHQRQHHDELNTPFKQKTQRILHKLTHNKDNSEIQIQTTTAKITNRTSALQQHSNTIIKPQNYQLQYKNNGYKCNQLLLKQRDIQNWLNTVIIEYSNQEEYGRHNIENQALKKLLVDRNALLSNGISTEHVTRIYRSLYVYSIGFNNLLKELTGKNMELIKTLWKVYAILLEYCAEGNFQTMIGDIERDKAKKLSQLRGQIEKRQIIIESADEINQEKNLKIHKQLKFLRQENKNLQSEKIVLIEDYKQAEQAFNQQVALRLKFQNKINQIHGVHQQLLNKHKLLNEDFKKVINDLSILHNKYNKLNQQFTSIKAQLNETYKILQANKKQNLFNLQLAEQSKLRMKEKQIDILKWKGQSEQNKIKMLESERRISQLETNLKNTEIIIKSQKASNSELQKDYSKLLQENKNLYEDIWKQTQTINKLLQQKKIFNESTISIQAQYNLQKNKVKKMIQDKIELNKTISILQESLEMQKIVTKAKQCLCEQIQSNLDQCYLSIQKMKQAKNKMEEKISLLEKKQQQHQLVIEQKNTQIFQLKEVKQQMIKQTESLTILNKSMESKILLLDQRLQLQQDINKKKYSKLKIQKDQLKAQNEQYNGKMAIKQQDLEKYTGLYQDAYASMKNQKFQRKNLELRYKQSLQAVELENQHIRQLNINISSFKEDIQKLTRKNRSFEFLIEEKEKMFQKERQFFQSNTMHLKDDYQQKKEYVHPMRLEDIYQQYHRQADNLSRYKLLLKQQQNRSWQKAQNYDKKLKQFHLQAQQNLKQKINEYEKDLEKKNIELEFKLDQVQNNEIKINKLEQKIQLYKKQINQINIVSSGTKNQRQRKYLQVIEQKNQNIQKIQKQLSINLNKNYILRNQLQEKQKQLLEIKIYNNKIIQQLEIKNQSIKNYQEESQLLTNVKQKSQNLIIDIQPNSEIIKNVEPSVIKQRNTIYSRSNKTKSGEKNRKKSIQSSSLVHGSKQQQINTSTINKTNFKNKNIGQKIQNAYNYYQK